MATASPLFYFAGQDPGEDASVSAGATVVATLDSLDGVRRVEWSIVGTDETTDDADYTLIVSGPVGSVCTTTALVAGTAASLRCRINSGIDERTEQPSDATSTIQTFWVPTTTGLRVKALGEDSAATSRDVATVNAAVRAVDSGGGGGGGSTTAKLFVDAVATSNVSNLASASVTQDGVTLTAGKRLLLPFQTTASQNGIYTVGTVGGGLAPLTRSTDADTSAEVVTGMRVYVAQGTRYQGSTWVLATTGSITLDTTALVFVEEGQPIDPRLFGAKADDTTARTTNRTALAAAQAAAQTLGVPIKWTRGNYYITSTAASPGLHVTSGKLTMRGDGLGQTTLTIGPATLSEPAIAGIRCAAGTTIEVADLTVAGTSSTTNVTSASVTLTFDNAAKTIVRSSGSFTTDGFTAGMYIALTGVADAGNIGPFLVATVSGATITVNAAYTLTNAVGDTGCVVTARVLVALGIQATGATVTATNVKFDYWTIPLKIESAGQGRTAFCQINGHSQGVLVSDDMPGAVYEDLYSTFTITNGLHYEPQHCVYCNIGASLRLVGSREVGVSPGQGYAFEHYNSLGGTFTGTETLTFNDAAHTIVRASGNFVSDGFVAGQRITISGTVDAINVGPFTIATVAASTLTVLATDHMADEVADTGCIVTATAPPPQFSEFTNVHVQDRTGDSTGCGLLANSLTKAIFTGCSVGNVSSIQIGIGEAGATLSGCRLYGIVGQYGILDQAGCDGGVTITGLDARVRMGAAGDDSVGNGVAVIAINANTASGQWKITDSYIEVQVPTDDLTRAGHAILVTTVVSDVDLVIGTTRIVTTTSATNLNGIGFLGGGRLELLPGTRFEGFAGLYMNGNANTELVVHNGVEFNSANAASGFWVNWPGSGTPTLTVRGGAPRFAGTGPTVSVGGGAVVKGWLALYPEVGAAVASASTLTVSPNADTVHVTGTTTINTIAVAGTGTPTAIFKGPLRLIADGAWALGTSGNIKPRTVAPRVADDVVVLSYDSVAGYWYEESSTSRYVLPTTKTGTYTAAIDELVRVDPSGGGFTVNLPTAASAIGRGIVVQNVTSSTNTVTIDGSGGETINGAATYALSTAYGRVALISDGTAWYL